MTTEIPALSEASIKHCLLINLTVNTTTYYISNAYAPISYDGNDYTQLGHFISMSEIQDDLEVTNNQINISMSGLPPTEDGEINYMGIVLNSKVKGSRIEIYRAFFDGDGFYDPTAVYLRFQGYVSNYQLNENWDQDNKIVSNSVGIQCSSVNAIMEKKFTGRRTNDQDQQLFFSGDTGMSKVKSLADASFDFGKPYSG